MVGKRSETCRGQMLPGLGFAILLRYLPVRRNLHYLALGFGLTAMLTVLYSNVQSLGAAVSSIVGSEVFAKLPKEQAITFVNNFKSVSMIGYCHYRYLPCSTTLQKQSTYSRSCSSKQCRKRGN